MIQLNLLPDVKKDYLKSQRMKRNIIAFSILASIGSIVLVLLLALYVHGAQRIARNQLQSDIDKSSKEFQSLPDINKVLTVQGALASLPGLHDQKNVDSRLFDYLKVLVPNEVSLSKLELTHKGNSLKLTGRSVDYKALNIFVDTLKSAAVTTGPEDSRQKATPFKKVTITNATKASDPQRPGIEFIVSLEFDPKIFNAKTVKPEMNIPTTTTGQGFVKSNELFSGSREETSGGAQQ